MGSYMGIEIQGGLVGSKMTKVGEIASSSTLPKKSGSWRRTQLKGRLMSAWNGRDEVAVFDKTSVAWTRRINIISHFKVPMIWSVAMLTAQVDIFQMHQAGKTGRLESDLPCFAQISIFGTNPLPCIFPTYRNFEAELLNMR